MDRCEDRSKALKCLVFFEFYIVLREIRKVKEEISDLEGDRDIMV